MQLFASDDNGIHVIPLVDNSYFKPNPACRIPDSLSRYPIETVQNSSQYAIPEFSYAVPVLLVGILSTIAFYRMKYRK
jgi:hypothetical protein